MLQSLIGILLLSGAAAAQLQFTEAAGQFGVNVPTFGRGAAMVDFDGDGLLDLATSNDSQPNRFFKQNPDHTFTDMSAAWGIAPDFDSNSWGMAAADLDNDGDPDVVIANGGFYALQVVTVLRNDLDTLGVFTDVSTQAGDLGGPLANHGITLLDYDRDGLLDVFLTGDAVLSFGLGQIALLHNEGDLVFSDQTASAGLAGILGGFRHCSSGDIDNDGWPDLAAGDAEGANLLLRNNGDGTFEDIAEAAGVSSPGRNFGLVFEDFNNDGWMDLYDPKYQVEVVLTISRLFINLGDGTFLDVSSAVGMTGQEDMGHNSGDLDNDGYPEIYMGTGSPQAASTDVLLKMTPNGSGGLIATNVTFSSGLAALGMTRSHGSVFGDIDDDGDVDMYINSGGPHPLLDTLEANYLLLNHGNANHWVKVGLEGVASNRSAVGARLQAVTTAGNQFWTHLAAGKGFGNTDSPIRQIGLGTDDALDRIVVFWPSGITQSLYAPAVDTRHDLIETGILIGGVVQLGGRVTITVVGPPDHVAELLVGAIPGTIPLPKFGGELAMLPPFLGPIALPLGPSGRLDLPAVIPTDPVLVGLPILLQAWVHETGATQGGTLTSAATLVVK